ncbi:flavin reductase family protein [Puteibacter caeruleilacunae]|nr:flavin reductase family protein [Puteibacter caeruleilacunae]
MKKNIGAIMGLYPTPVTIVGTQSEERVNWINIAHLGVIGSNLMILSLGNRHYSNEFIKKNMTLSINLVDEAMMVKADYVGMVTGWRTDKSDVFNYTLGELKGAPLIKESPLSIECEVLDIIKTGANENFIVRAVNTYVDDECLDEEGKIDYEKVQPLLFEMPNRQYLSIGKAVGKCWSEGKKYNSNNEE